MENKYNTSVNELYQASPNSVKLYQIYAFNFLKIAPKEKC